MQDSFDIESMTPYIRDDGALESRPEEDWDFEVLIKFYCVQLKK